MTAHPRACDCQFTGKKPFRGRQILAGFFGAKPPAPARFAVPGAPSLTALSRHDSHNSLPLCLPSGGCLAHQHTPSELICLFFDSGHLPNTVFTLFYLTGSDCTLWRSGTASLTAGTRNLQEEVRLRTCKFRVPVCIR